MGWYANQKARHEAKVAGEPRPELDDWQGRAGRKAAAALAEGHATAERAQAEKAARKAAKRR